MERKPEYIDKKQFEPASHVSHARNKNIKETADKKRDSKEYELIKQKLPDCAPKSFGGYRRMKNSKSKNYQLLKEKCADCGIILNEK